MPRFFDAGRLLFGAALIGLGLEPFLTGHLPMALTLPPPWLPSWVAMLLGALLVASAVAAMARPRLAAAQIALLAFPVVDLLVAHLPRLAAAPRDPLIWSGIFQVVGFVAGPLFLLRPKAGRVALAAALAVYGIQHFMYASFIASLVPHWIPVPLFWAWATGLAFIAAAVSVAANRFVFVSTTLLGVMFSSWVLTVHVPRIAAGLTGELGWTSGFVALALAGVSFMFAGSSD